MTTKMNVDAKVQIADFIRDRFDKGENRILIENLPAEELAGFFRTTPWAHPKTGEVRVYVNGLRVQGKWWFQLNREGFWQLEGNVNGQSAPYEKTKKALVAIRDQKV